MVKSSTSLNFGAGLVLKNFPFKPKTYEKKLRGIAENIGNKADVIVLEHSQRESLARNYSEVAGEYMSVTSDKKSSASALVEQNKFSGRYLNDNSPPKGYKSNLPFELFNAAKKVLLSINENI